jgi:hypothetical protein
MKNKLNRLHEAIAYLKGKRIIKNQQDIVDEMGANKSVVSQALKGVDKYFTDNFLVKFCKAFLIINANWLIYGSGNMLNEAEQPKQLEFDFDRVMGSIEKVIDDNAQLIDNNTKLVDSNAKLVDSIVSLTEQLKDVRRVVGGRRAAI